MCRVYAYGQFTYFMSIIIFQFKPFGKLIFLAKAINMIVSVNSKQWLMIIIINDSNLMIVCVYPWDTLRMPQEIVQRVSFHSGSNWNLVVLDFFERVKC